MENKLKYSALVSVTNIVFLQKQKAKCNFICVLISKNHNITKSSEFVQHNIGPLNVIS